MNETTLSPTSLSTEAENIAKLRAIFPDVACEGKIDFDKLRQVLGEYVDDDKERYSFTWNGKGQALRHAQTPSMGTLRPCKEESKNWDTTQNLYIEGDNLEVLKLLQKTYHRKVKMIYIDPPYNTGKDFVYPDNYRNSLKNYQEITKQVDENGRKNGTNTETSGRYHTDWLNMMYPRLRLARNLLRDDGVIFISIDDNEVHNLRKMCDEIFGEENFVAQISTINNLKGRSDDSFFAACNEFLLVYGKNKQVLSIKGFELNDEEMEDDYDKKDEIGFYKVIGLRKTGIGWQRVNRPYMFYPILFIDNMFSTISNEEFAKIYNNATEEFDDKYISSLRKIYESRGYKFILPQNEHGEYGRWRWGRETFLQEKDINLTMNGNETVCSKMRATIEDGSIRVKTAKTLWYKPEYDTGSGAKILKSLFGITGDIFPNPKSILYLQDIVRISSNQDSVILDFFSGSATTAHAVMQLNAEDGGSRRFIMVQLPERTPKDSEARKAGYKNICEIGKERIRRAGLKMLSNKVLLSTSPCLDTGFRVLKLNTSNIKEWNPDYENLRESLKEHVENYVQGRTELDVVYEIMLKYGLDLACPIEELTVHGKKIYAIVTITGSYLCICLDNDITTDIAQALVNFKKERQLENDDFRVLFKDNGFKDDSAKTNIKEILKLSGAADFVTV